LAPLREPRHCLGFFVPCHRTHQAAASQHAVRRNAGSRYSMNTFEPVTVATFLQRSSRSGRTPWQQGTGLPVSGHCHEHTRSDPRTDPEGQAPSSGPARQREQPPRSDLLILGAPRGAFFMAARSSPAAGVAPEPDPPGAHRPQPRADGCPAAAGRWWPPHGADCPDRAGAAGRSR